MKTSELIKQLQASLELNGDLPVVLVEDNRAGTDRFLVSDLEVCKNFAFTEYNQRLDEYIDKEVLPLVLLIS